MTYSNTVIKDFADFMEPVPVKTKSVQKLAIKPTVFRKPPYPVEKVRARLDELLKERVVLVGNLSQNTKNIKLLEQYLEAVKIG